MGHLVSVVVGVASFVFDLGTAVVAVVVGVFDYRALTMNVVEILAENIYWYAIIAIDMLT